MPFPLLVAILAAAAPLLATGSERWPGLAPCPLCLWQRWPYWVAAAIALAALAMPGRFRRWALRGAALAVLASGAIAAVHVGVEFGWWPSPLPACLAPTATLGSVDDMLASLPAMPGKPCDAPAYAFDWLPLTVPQMNLVYALALGAFTWWGAGRGAGERTEFR